ncbi:MAG: hypothetical protein J7647_30960 [Cyanobacteria bacterium SBLK]|nr:hypothetical protein [Cyanobacteria bacterium SBLK]
MDKAIIRFDLDSFTMLNYLEAEHEKQSYLELTIDDFANLGDTLEAETMAEFLAFLQGKEFDEDNLNNTPKPEIATLYYRDGVPHSLNGIGLQCDGDRLYIRCGKNDFPLSSIKSLDIEIDADTKKNRNEEEYELIYLSLWHSESDRTYALPIRWNLNAFPESANEKDYDTKREIFFSELPSSKKLKQLLKRNQIEFCKWLKQQEIGDFTSLGTTISTADLPVGEYEILEFIQVITKNDNGKEIHYYKQRLAGIAEDIWTDSRQKIRGANFEDFNKAISKGTPCTLRVLGYRAYTGRDGSEKKAANTQMVWRKPKAELIGGELKKVTQETTGAIAVLPSENGKESLPF